ncbi:MAG: hypothetical protein ACI8SJ_001823, partial [Shewanella sp.]
EGIIVSLISKKPPITTPKAMVNKPTLPVFTAHPYNLQNMSLLNL